MKRSSQNTPSGIPSPNGGAVSGAGGRASMPAPLAAYEIEPCDWCHRPHSIEVLTPVIGEGILCWGCVERLRDSGLGAGSC